MKNDFLDDNEIIYKKRESSFKLYYQQYKEYFGIPEAYKLDIAQKNARRLLYIMVPIVMICILSLIGMKDVWEHPLRILYFGGYGVLCTIALVYSCYVIKHPKMKVWKQTILAYYGIAVSMGLCLVNTYTSSHVINGFLVLSLVSMVTVMMLTLDPMIYTLFFLPTSVVIIEEIWKTYGRDTLIDVSLAAAAFIAMAFLNRRINVRQMMDDNALHDAIKRAEAADDAKSAFLARMSHEIRSPINAVLGMDEMIIRESSEPDVIGYAEQIQTSGNTLVSLINDILDFSKIESGMMELVNVEYDVSSLINDSLNMVAMRANDKGLKLLFDNNPDIPHLLYGDQARIKQIILNLLTNAVKYTDTGEVKLSLDYRVKNDNQIELFVGVRDTGRGIKPEDMSKLLMPFERIDETHNYGVEGTGLGLNISKLLLDLMGSKLNVISTYGEGSTFSFTILQDVKDWEPMGVFSTRYKESRAKEGNVYVPRFVAPEARILVVDDMQVNLTVFTSLLKQTKLQIDTALSGFEALVLCSNEKYDMIFLDHMMPEMDGFETMDHIKQDRSSLNKEAPIIMLTANAIAGMREQYIEAGFTDYMSKPISSAKLEDLIIHYLPADKCQSISDEEYKQALEKAAGPMDITVGLDEEEQKIILALDELPMLQVREAVATLGDAKTYLNVVKDFCSTSSHRIALIEEYYENKDIRNYVIQVHALKSTAKMVGDMGLSALAFELEKAGNEGNLRLIEDQSGKLLTFYDTISNRLQSVFDSFAAPPTELELIEMRKFKQGLREIKEGMEVFDFDIAEAIMRTFSKVQIPEGYQDLYDNLKVMMAEVDRDGIMESIENALESMEDI